MSLYPPGMITDHLNYPCCGRMFLLVVSLDNKRCRAAPFQYLQTNENGRQTPGYQEKNQGYCFTDTSYHVVNTGKGGSLIFLPFYVKGDQSGHFNLLIIDIFDTTLYLC
jgi:hypothetical protein